MLIKSLSDLRRHYKIAVRKKTDENINTDFIGVYHNKNHKQVTGLFELFHGDKKIEKFLPSLLKIAEDGQAIYEFLQNAVDCNSSQFFIFYNDEYFLAVNNGKPFKHKDVLSILNIANTTKDYDCDQIGRFGIGFKLVHRLVGQDEGIKELIEEYKGPVIYSWEKIDHLKLLLSRPKLFPNDSPHPDFDGDGHPWLFKIIATNFPAEPGEEVLDINYQKRVVFPYSELGEMVDFLKQNLSMHQGAFNFDNLQQGSAFFLKLGQGKRSHLDKDYNDLRKGVQYSMNFLKHLEEVFINDRALKKYPLLLKNFEIERDSEVFERINPEYKECNIKISFGYTDYSAAEGLRTSPNFYKYFPMGDETNGFSFIVHCDSFDIEANRRKLHESNKNKNLLPEISKYICGVADDLKQKNAAEFAKLYANLLISKIPENDNNKWLNECFFNNILAYIRSNIPTAQGCESNSENVKIKSFELPIDLKSLGLATTKWFYWSSNKYADLLTEANLPEKLNIEKWSLRDVFINADIDLLNIWIREISENEYYAFIRELDKQNFIKDSIGRLTEAKLFRFNDGAFYSIDEVFNTPHLLFSNDKIKGIIAELTLLGFTISELDISTLNLYEKVSLKTKVDIDIYQQMALRTAEANSLTATGKLKLFKNLSDPATKFIGVGNDTLKKLKLFCNADGVIKPLRELISFVQPTPYWLQQFKIKESEYSNLLDEYVLSEEEIYRVLILPEWELIIGGITDYKSFYKDVSAFFAMEENNAFLGNRSFVATKKGFQKADDVFFNNHFIKIKDYGSLHNGINKLTNLFIPQKEILPFLTNSPFKVDSKDFTEHEIDDNAVLTINELKALLEFSAINNEFFFEDFIIRESTQGFFLTARQHTVRQYFSADAKVTEYLKREHATAFVLLPKQLFDFREAVGVLREQDLHNQIVEAVDGDEQLLELVGLIRYSDPKIKLLLKLKRISIDTTLKFDAESLEYKLLDMACKELVAINHQEYFRGKLYLKNENSKIRLTEIPTSGNIVSFQSGEVKLSLAKIFPESHQNTAMLHSLLLQFVSLGLPEPVLRKLLGATDELNFRAILDLIGKIPENGDQLAFVLFYHKYCEPIDLNDYQVNTLDGECALSYNYYTKEYPFISKNAILNGSYDSIKSILQCPFTIDAETGTKLYEEPMFVDEVFICNDLKDNLEEEDKIHLLNFIYQKWKGPSKSIIKKIDWTKIDDTDTSAILGFDPTLCVHPQEFAIQTEYLPANVIEWIIQNKIEVDFLMDLGVQVKSSVIFDLRDYFKNATIFRPTRISIENNEDLLFNTFEWMKENDLQIRDDTDNLIFEEIYKTINLLRDERGYGHLELIKAFDFDLLQSQSIELTDNYYINWQDELEGKYKIFAHSGALPKLLTLDEIDEYVFWRYAEDDIAISPDGVIYANNEKDLQGLLYSLVAQEKVLAEEVLKFIQIKSVSLKKDDYQVLTNRIKELERVIANFERVDRRDNVDITVSADEYTNEIKEKSERQLFNYLKDRFKDKKVVWLNVKDSGEFSESWKDHDFEIYNESGDLINYIDCKGTPGSKKTFYLSQNEWEFFLTTSDNYQIYRVFNVESTPEILEIYNLMDWLMQGKVVPYLEATETIRGGRVFLTIKS